MASITRFRRRRRDFIIIYTQVLFIWLIMLIDKSSIVLCSSDSSIIVKKCCPAGSVLIQKDKTAYSCESVPPSTKNAVEFFQRISGSSGFPVCPNPGNLRTILFDDFNENDNSYVRGDHCADMFYNFHFDNQDFNDSAVLRTAVLFCDDNSDQKYKRRDIPSIVKIRRCCNDGEIFKFKNRACLQPDDDSLQEDISTASLVRNLGTSADFIHVIRGPPKCQHAIVDYEVNATEVSIAGGRLQVTASSSYDVVDLLATEESACLDVGSSPGLLVVRVCRGIEYCRNNPCLRKCCAEDEALVGSTCQKSASHLTVSKWHSEVWELPKIMQNTTNKIMNTTEYGLLLGKPCFYLMYPVSRDEGWHIVTEGRIHVPGYKTYEHDQYCTDMFYNHSYFEDGFYPFICFEDPPAEDDSIKTRFRVNAALLIISCAFLAMTLLVYICLPTLQNLHGKTLMCHVASLLMAFGCLAVVAVATPKEEYDRNSEATILSSASLCRFLGYTMLFAFLSAFFWLNVMCFDIWWKFGSLRHSGKTNTKRKDDFKRFLSYCLYAWGLALAFIIVAIIADEIEFLPTNFRPDIGFNRCWFATEKAVYGEVLFFTGPVSIQLLINSVFFILTARRCSMVKAEIQKRVMVNRSDPRRRKFESDKTKLTLNIKLFVVMGISWLLEIISYFLSNYVTNIQWKEEFFYVSDVVNCLQGLLIFVLFVLKRKVFHALRKKFCNKNNNRRASAGGIFDPYRVRKTPSSSTILSTFAVSSSP